ncbi:hypothetical protein HK098_003720 [Nowakowskiella sp. JEL0407]|nr:hypothetical protein HK098_003720 [Nowakowskiella sp. JEL0407]
MNLLRVPIEPKTIKPYTIESSEQFAPWIILEVRGAEPVEYVLKDDLSVVGAESGTKFNEIDLTEGEWVEYDEEAKEPVGIMDIETKITKV